MHPVASVLSGAASCACAYRHEGYHLRVQAIVHMLL
jgi:hypothetical protein